MKKIIVLLGGLFVIGLLITTANAYNSIVSDPSDFWGKCDNGGVYSGSCDKNVFGPVYCTVAGPNGGDGYSQSQSEAIRQACGE